MFAGPALSFSVTLCHEKTPPECNWRTRRHVRRRYQGAGSFEGKSFTDDQRCVMIWEKQAGEWRLVMEQCSFSSS